MAEHRNRECMFCHEEMAPTVERPVNLLWMEHIERRADCREQFSAWKANMGQDFKGD